MSEPIQNIFIAPKTIPVMPEWAEGEEGVQSWVAPLAIDGVTVQGLRLRVKAIKNEPVQAITAQLEYLPAGKRSALDRIDWNPIHRHNNRDIGPDEYRFKLQAGSHHHKFWLNLKDDGLAMRRGNLPIAVPLPTDINDFSELLDFIAYTYNISGLENLLPPEWKADLF